MGGRPAAPRVAADQQTGRRRLHGIVRVFEALVARRMSWNRPRPALDRAVNRRPQHAETMLPFALRHAQQPWIVALSQRRIPHSAHGRREADRARRRPARKQCARKQRPEHLPVFDLRHQHPEAVERMRHLAARVGREDRHDGRLLDLAPDREPFGPAGHFQTSVPPARRPAARAPPPQSFPRPPTPGPPTRSALRPRRVPPGDSAAKRRPPPAPRRPAVLPSRRERRKPPLRVTAGPATRPHTPEQRTVLLLQRMQFRKRMPYRPTHRVARIDPADPRVERVVERLAAEPPPPEIRDTLLRLGRRGPGPRSSMNAASSRSPSAREFGPGRCSQPSPRTAPIARPGPRRLLQHDGVERGGSKAREIASTRWSWARRDRAQPSQGASHRWGEAPHSLRACPPAAPKPAPCPTTHQDLPRGDPSFSCGGQRLSSSALKAPAGSPARVAVASGKPSGRGRAGVRPPRPARRHPCVLSPRTPRRQPRLWPRASAYRTAAPTDRPTIARTRTHHAPPPRFVHPHDPLRPRPGPRPRRTKI